MGSIKGVSSVKPLVVTIPEALIEIEGKRETINLYWIKPHLGIAGYEQADALTKAAALINKPIAMYDGVPEP